jgi:hypothetical protein
MAFECTFNHDALRKESFRSHPALYVLNVTEARLVLIFGRSELKLKMVCEFVPTICLIDSEGGIRDVVLSVSDAARAWIRHRLTSPVGTLMVTVVEPALRAALMLHPGGAQAPAPRHLPAGFGAVGVPLVAAAADEEGSAASATATRSEECVRSHGDVRG